VITRDIYAQANAEFACRHSEVALRRRLVGEGAHQHEQICKQCLRCGKWLETVSKHALSRTAVAELEPYDEQAYPDWQERFRARVRELREAKQQDAQEDWWARYEAYLASPRWQQVSAAVLAREKGICQGCFGRSGLPATQAHHLTYDHVGEEFGWELAAVCIRCHERLHGRPLSGGRAPAHAEAATVEAVESLDELPF
jgi:5-methylcytosine-specific restriction endonuclease McrA